MTAGFFPTGTLEMGEKYCWDYNLFQAMESFLKAIIKYDWVFFFFLKTFSIPFTNIPGVFILGHPCCAFSKGVAQISLSWAPAAEGVMPSARNFLFLSNAIHWKLGKIRKTFKQLSCLQLFSFPSQAVSSTPHWLKRRIHWSSSCWVFEQCSPWHPPSSALLCSSPLYNSTGDAAGQTNIWISFPQLCLKRCCKTLEAMQRDSHERTLEWRHSHPKPSATHQEREGTALLVPSLYPLLALLRSLSGFSISKELDNKALIKTCLPGKQWRGWNTNRNRRNYSSFWCCISQTQ